VCEGVLQGQERGKQSKGRREGIHHTRGKEQGKERKGKKGRIGKSRT
jgi:hypothetical protein